MILVYLLGVLISDAKFNVLALDKFLQRSSFENVYDFYDLSPITGYACITL